ncbi:MAG: M48 family peptidase [Planctomycetes bacterium]|nr:M48 family peptidase [Planctomycetota bacterium]
MNDSKKAKVCLQRIVNLFKEGDIPKALAIATIPPQADIPSAKWSWGNKVLQFLADTSDARGFRQWEQACRKVNKGAKAFHILGPKARTIKETDENGQKTEKVILTGFFAIAVFRAEDTDGEPLPYEPASPPPLADVAEEFGLSVSYQTFASGHYGYYQGKSKRIVLATHEAQVFFHELAHAAHHRIAGKLKGGQVPSQEIIAELTAATLSRLYCPEANLGFSYEYVKSYAKKSRKSIERACLAVINTVGKVLDEILNTHLQLKEEVA